MHHCDDNDDLNMVLNLGSSSMSCQSYSKQAALLFLRWLLIPVNISAVRQLLILSVILIIRLQLLHDARIRIGANHHSQRRILHHRKLIHGLRTLLRVTSLRPMSRFHRFLGIHVVVRRMAVRKGHASAGPISPEPAGLDARELDAPLWLDLLLDSLREAFDSPLRGTV